MGFSATAPHKKPPSAFASFKHWRRGLRRLLLRRVLVRLRSRPRRPAPGAVLVVAPHQDDETLGCGGYLATRRRAGDTVEVVFLTDGSRSHGDLAGPERVRLAETRRAEALAALGVLGVPAENVHFLDLPDGELGTLPDAPRAEADARLRALLDRLRPAEVLVPHRRDSHPDHEAAFRLVAGAVAGAGVPAPVVYEYAVWLLWSRNRLFGNLRWGDLAGARRLPLDLEARERKRRAMSEYRTQLETLPTGFAEYLLAPDDEIFFRTLR